MRRFLYNDPRTAQFIAKSVGSTDCQCHSSIALEEDGQIIAGALFDNYSGPNIFIHFSSSEVHSFPRDLLKLVFGYAFNALKVKRVTGAFSSSNKRVKKLGELIGFKYETKLAGACQDGDLLFYCLKPADCRFLV